MHRVLVSIATNQLYPSWVRIDQSSAFIAIPPTADLALTGKRIVTSYEVLAQEYFREVDERAGLTGDEGTRIEYVSGSVEAACALGLADGIGTISPPSSSLTHIDCLYKCNNPSPPTHYSLPATLVLVVDLVESGETMRAAGLHPLSTLLQTSAVLIRSTTAKHPSLEPLIAKVASRIAGFVASNKYIVCQVRCLALPCFAFALRYPSNGTTLLHLSPPPPTPSVSTRMTDMDMDMDIGDIDGADCRL